MYCFPLTNWITLRGQSSVTSVTQSEAQWLDLRGFQDFVAWLEVKETTLPSGATHVTLQYQTSPTKDEGLFQQVGTTINLDTLVSGAVYINIQAVRKDDPVTSLARWLRYQLAVTGSPSAARDATFRIWVAANIGATPKQLKARMPNPPLRPTGKSCNGDCQAGGSAPVAPSQPPTARQGLPLRQRPGTPDATTRGRAALAHPSNALPNTGLPIPR